MTTSNSNQEVYDEENLYLDIDEDSEEYYQSNADVDEYDNSQDSYFDF